MTEVELVRLLDRALQLQRKPLKKVDAYYEGEQPLKYMAAALEAEIGDRVTQLVINWPRLVADAYEERLDIQGFRLPDADGGDAKLWEMWQANDGDEQAQQAHQESLVCGRSYVIVGAGDAADDAPVMTVEHPLQVIARRDPKTRKIKEGLKRWKDEGGGNWAQLYLPDANVTFRRGRGGWVEDKRDDHEVGRPLMVDLVNRRRMLRQLGKSEFVDVIPVADAANKMATDMMVSGEFHAMPRRWAVGMTEDDFEDEEGKPLSTWSIIAGRIWGTDKKPSEVTLGTFTETDLAVFHNTIKVLAQLASQLAYLPQDYMGFTSDNPTSADAMRSAESRMVKRCERKQTTLGGGWEEVQRLMLRVQTGEWDPKAKMLETLWRDPSTPTKAQVADAVVKLTQGDRPIIPVEQAREDLGYSPEQRRRMAEMDQNAADRDLLGSLAEQFRQPPAPVLTDANA